MTQVCDNPVCVYWKNGDECTAPENIYEPCFENKSNLHLMNLVLNMERGWEKYIEFLEKPVNVEIVHMKFPPVEKNTKII